ncbi:MAG: hypothetical protein AAB209_13350 [Bacteroidota bacterium]
MAKNKKTKIPSDFKEHMTMKEASDYWDKLSFDEFDDIEEVKFDVTIEHEKHFLLLDDKVAKKLEAVAGKKKLHRHELGNELLMKSLAKVA